MSLGRTRSSDSFALWYGELDDGHVAYITLCSTAGSEYSKYLDSTSTMTYYLVSVTIGENEYEAKIARDILTPLRIGSRDKRLTYNGDILNIIKNKMNWSLPDDYIDYIF